MAKKRKSKKRIKDDGDFEGESLDDNWDLYEERRRDMLAWD